MIPRIVALTLVLVAATARAEPPAGSVDRTAPPSGGASGRAQVPTVDVQDLPPLPAADEEPTAAATVLAASSVEEDVVVGAGKREQSLGNVASAVTVISGDRIRRFGYRTVGEAVAAVAGVYLEDNRLVGAVGIRGLNIPGDFNTRILVLIDGATVNEAWGSFAGVGYDSFVSIDDVARIEVIRGPVSSLYGANAFFGIINIVTRGALETPRAWGSVGVNSVNGVVSSAGFSTGNLRRQLRGTVQVMDRFGDTTGVPAIGSGLSSDGASQLAGSLVGTYHGSFVQLRAYRERRDSPFAPYNGDLASSVPYREVNSQVLVEGGHTHEVTDRLTVTARGYANLYSYTDHINQIGAASFVDIGDAATYGGELRGRYEIVPKRLGITAGTEASYDKTKSHSYQEDGSIDTSVPKDFNIEGVYAEADGEPVPWLGFTGGVRYDRNSVIDTRVSPRLALFLARPERYGLKLLYAEGFRNPSAYEAFFYDGASFAKPDDLHAETIRSTEVVLWAKPVPGLSLRASGFSWDARGIIEQLPSMANPNLLQFQNVGRYVSQGVELEGSYRTASGWYAFGGGTYADVGCEACGAYMAATGLQSGYVPDAPALVASGGISTPKLGGLAYLSTELLYVGKRATRPDSDASGNLVESPASPAWYDWNWALYLPDLHGYDVTAGVRNLIGTRNHVVAPGDYDRFDAMGTTTLVPYVPGEGREVYVKVGYRY